VPFLLDFGVGAGVGIIRVIREETEKGVFLYLPRCRKEKKARRVRYDRPERLSVILRVDEWVLLLLHPESKSRGLSLSSVIGC
jgi:hypothetical protein